jgi:hypothetical protein
MELTKHSETTMAHPKDLLSGSWRVENSHSEIEMVRSKHWERRREPRKYWVMTMACSIPME